MAEPGRKTYRARMEFKEDGEPGMVSAVFSTFNVIDHDHDVTLPGAFEENAPVRIAAWNHGWNQLPVGRGEIHETESEARMDGLFFLDTESGKEHYLTVKALGELQEWSYSFDILEHEYGKMDDQDVRFLKKLKVHEVSPVMLGAGIDTRTLVIKAKDQDNLLASLDQRLQALEKVFAASTSTFSGELSDGSGEIEDEAGDGKSREKPGESTISRIDADNIEYDLPGPEEGA